MIGFLVSLKINNNLSTHQATHFWKETVKYIIFFPAVDFIAVSTSCVCLCTHIFIFLSKDFGYWTDFIITPHIVSNSYYTISTERFFGYCLPQLFATSAELTACQIG